MRLRQNHQRRSQEFELFRRSWRLWDRRPVFDLKPSDAPKFADVVRCQDVTTRRGDPCNEQIVGANPFTPAFRVRPDDARSFIRILVQLCQVKSPVSEFYENVTHLFSLGREIPVDTGGSEGFIDNMLVTDDGHLVVVETKLWRSSEAIRAVVSQTLHYAMAVSQLSPFDFEACLSRADPRWRRLGKGETVAQYVQNFAASNSLPGLPDDFEDAFDRLRRAGEILLLIVGDGIRPSAERLVHWMNTTAGSAPYKLGLIELCLYDLPGAARIAVPRTLLRTREASRHVVSVNLQGTARDQVAVTVTGPDKRHETRKIPLPGIPLTEERLTELIRSSNPPEIVEVAEQLRSLLKSSGMATRSLPSEIQYGVRVDEEFIPLVHLSAQFISFLIPMRAIRALSDDRFVECKVRINSVAPVFYRPMDVDDPGKTNALMPKYGILKDKVEAFAGSVTEIAETVRNAMEAAS